MACNVKFNKIIALTIHSSIHILKYLLYIFTNEIYHITANILQQYQVNYVNINHLWLSHVVIFLRHKGKTKCRPRYERCRKMALVSALKPKQIGKHSLTARNVETPTCLLSLSNILSTHSKNSIREYNLNLVKINVAPIWKILIR